MSYQNGIINHLIENVIEIRFVDDPDPEATKITESNIVSESMTLKQSICDSDALRFGGCIASEFSIKLLNTVDRQFDDSLVGKWISVKITQHYADPDALLYPSSTLYPSNELYPGKTTGSQSFYVFSGYIDSAKIDKTDKNVWNIVAYDALAKLHQADATDWLYSFFKGSQGSYSISYILEQALKISTNGVAEISKSNNTLYFNEQYFDGVYDNTLVGSWNPHNDYWLSRKDKITFGNLIKSICEMIAVFGVIESNAGKGTFSLKRLKDDTETYTFYEKLETEDYQSTGYTDYQFNVSGGDRPGKSVLGGGISAAVVGAVDKIYDFTDNILIMHPYAVSSGSRSSTPFDYLVKNSTVSYRLAMNSEAAGLKGSQCTFSTYQPLTATLDGRLWVTVGSPIEILVNKTTVDGDYVIIDGEIQKETIQTYVLSRTLTGIQALTDTITAKGVR